MKKQMGITTITEDPTIDLALDTLRINKQALVFVNSKRSAEKTAEDISKKIKLEGQQKVELEQLGEQALHALAKPTKQCERLASCIKKGIAFHNAGLVQEQKELIEDSFRAGKIKIICCTPTLAAGVDLPSFRTILKDLKRFSSPQGMVWISVLEYEQMAGRSGRPRYDTYGEAIAIASSEKEKENIFEKYVCGTPEEIYSKLAVEPVLRTYILSLIAAEFVTNKQE
ncbi:ATP-dependent DNA helicase, partial [Candidatus Woesearchaeota archaeon]|nr:ATP-dependent DNA helicase [Candidatus Woesearchaeota archaeon]